MDTRLPTSSTPYPFIREQIISPLATALIDGLYNAWVDVVDLLLAFAAQNHVLGGDQTLGGRYIDYLLSCEELPEDSPESIAAEAAIDKIWLLGDKLCDINDNAANGLYITPGSFRKDGNELRSGVVSFATGLAKDVIVALGVHPDSHVFDLGGGDGSILDTFVRMGVSKFASYTNIDTDPISSEGTFEKNAQRFIDTTESGAEITVLNRDFNGIEFSSIAPAGCVKPCVFTFHSLYFMDYPHRENLVDLGCSGVAHFSDLLFDGCDVEQDSQCDLALVNGRITGKIAGAVVSGEAPVFVDEVPLAYPVRFLQSARKTLHDFPVVSKSLCFWSDSFCYRGATIPNKSGHEYWLKPVNNYAIFQREKIHELDIVDYFYLYKMGYYLSAKIDGVCGFLTFSNGAYHLSFRDGTQFMVLSADNKHAVNLGFRVGTVCVEVVYNPQTQAYQFWYVSDAPLHYPTEPAERPVYFDSKFSCLRKRIYAAHKKYPTLFFKNYFWVPPSNERVAIFDPLFDTGLSELAPNDGLVFHDPFGQFVAYWKPWRTMDLYISNKKGSLVCDRNDAFVVRDERCVFIKDGIYECFIRDGDIHILHRRVEKLNETDLTSDPKLFDYVDGYYVIGAIQVKMPYVGFDDFMRLYAKNYLMVMNNVVSLAVRPDDLRVVFKIVSEYMKLFCQSYDGFYTVSDFVRTMSLKSSHDPTRLWSSFVKLGLMQGPGPYQPIIKHIGGAFKAVVKF